LHNSRNKIYSLILELKIKLFSHIFSYAIKNINQLPRNETKLNATAGQLKINLFALKVIKHLSGNENNEYTFLKHRKENFRARPLG